jgi:hypothetical protein
MVIGARGTNQEPITNPANPSSYATAPDDGVGHEIFTMYTDLMNANSQLTWGLKPAIYPTNANLITLAKNPKKYLNDPVTGAQSIAQEIQDTDAACGSPVHYILAGYSLGAWAVHDALINQLKTNQLNEISGVALFGDPKFQPFQPFDREVLDTGSGAATILPGDDSIPTQLVPYTGSWCILTDPICQAVPPLVGVGTENIWNAELALCAPGNSSLCAHYQYVPGGETAAAAAFLQPFLPGGTITGTLNAGGYAAIQSLSCPSPGNCSAGGYYEDGSGHVQAFVAKEVNGTWGNAIEVPGTATLNTDGYASVQSLSCASAGNCSAGGYYEDGSGSQQAFVAEEVNGTWGNAIEVPGTGTLNTGQDAEVQSLSCPSAGNCSAGGYYEDGSGSNLQAFVADEVNGTWGNAIEVPGTGTLNTGEHAVVLSLSCASAGNCSAGGSYTTRTGGSLYGQAFVADEVSGTWGNAIEVPGTATRNVGGGAEVASLSCPWAGNCSAAGYYEDGSGNRQGFVADEVNGTWGNAIEVPGTGPGALLSLSCPSAGNCTAGGSGADGSGNQQAFVAQEVNGTWRNAVELPGIATLNAGENAGVNSLSCGLAGNCSAGGYYRDGSGHVQAFVADEVNGTWGNAIEVPGTATLNAGGNAHVLSLSCPSAGNCSAGGYYEDRSGNRQAFVVSGF